MSDDPLNQLGEYLTATEAESLAVPSADGDTVPGFFGSPDVR